MQPAEALDRIAFLLERSLAPSVKVKAFRNAHAVLVTTDEVEILELATKGKLTSLSGIGKSTERVVLEALAGQTPKYLSDLEASYEQPAEEGRELRSALKGDLHTHSLWSDGGSPILEMARTGRHLGHEYILLTDHSPRLTVANGLTPERLQKQWEEIAEVNRILADEHDEGAPAFEVLRGIEVDINDDGSLDQEDDLLDQLDLVVGSVHSKLRSEKLVMTRRMLAAIENPRLDVLGHCTGRKVMERTRPPSEFDAEKVFAACVENDVAVEINSRPERKDPPRELLKLAVDLGCTFSVDTDAHAPGQLDFQWIGAQRAVACGVVADQVINTLSATELRAKVQAKRAARGIA